MTFYKDRYLRPTGRFHAIWRAAHGIPMNPDAEDDELMDICADLAQLLNPTRRARQQQQVLSLRFASNLVAGTAARHSQLTDKLLQDATNLLHEIQIRNNTNKDSENNQMTNLNKDDSKESEINIENISSLDQTRSISNPVNNSSNADSLLPSETEDACEICDDGRDESMSTVSADENEDDCNDNNDECNNDNDHGDKDTNHGENMNETWVDKSMSITEEVNESINQEYITEDTKRKNTDNSGARQFVSQSSNIDPFDLLSPGHYETSQAPDNLHVDIHESGNTTSQFMVTAEDFTCTQDAIRTPNNLNKNQRRTVPSVPLRIESSPIIHLSSDKRFQYKGPTDIISSPTILESCKSPILESNITDSENTSPLIRYRRRSLTSTDEDNERPILKRIRIAQENLSSIQEVQEFPLDLTTKPRSFNELRTKIIRPELPLDLRSPIHIEIGNQEMRIPEVLHVENPTTPSDCQAMAVDPGNEDSEIMQALDSSSWITMTETVLSSSVLEPAEISAHTTQASLPPGTRGVVTAPATRRRRVRKPRATLYRARKVKMTRCSPPITRLRAKNSLRAGRIVTSETTDQTTLNSIYVLQGNQNFTEIIEDQEMRGICLTHLDTSDKVVQRQASIQDTSISPINNELPVISYGNQLEDKNSFRSISNGSIEQIFQISPPQDSLLNFEMVEKALTLSPQTIYQRNIISSNQNITEITSTSASPQSEPRTITVYAEIHQPPNESISVSLASESVLSLTAGQNESASFKCSSGSRSTESSNFTEADSTTTDEGVQEETSVLEINEENEKEEEEPSQWILPESELVMRYVAKSRPLETILEESEPRYSEEQTVEKEIIKNQTDGFTEDNAVEITVCLQENEIHQDEVNIDLENNDVQNKDHEENISNENISQRKTSSIIDGEEEVLSLNEIIDDVQIYGELDISREENASIQNVASDVETTCSKDSLSTVSSLGLDCFSIIYKRNDLSRAVIMRSRISDDPELSRYISRRWMNQFN